MLKMNKSMENGSMERELDGLTTDTCAIDSISPFVFKTIF